MKYQWTDWITHVPGQQLPVGTYGIWEFLGTTRNAGLPYEVEATITAKQRGHPVWWCDNPNERKWCQLLRYKLRSVAEEAEVSAERELETADS